MKINLHLMQAMGTTADEEYFDSRANETGKRYTINFNFPITTWNYFFNTPRSIYQYSNVAPRLSGQTSIFGVVFFVSKSLLGN